MIDIDFDSWDDYKPVGDSDLKEIRVEDKNPNLFKLSADDEYETVGFEKDEFFENSSEFDYDENEFVRFIKDEEKNGLKIYHCPKDEDVFLLIKNDKKFVVYVYQSNEYYFDDNKLTLTGWDYNVVCDVDKMTFKTKYVR